MKRLAAAAAVALALSACTVNVPDPREKVSEVSEGLKSSATDAAQDAVFDRAYARPEFDQRHDLETTRTMAKDMCVEIETTRSVQDVMLKYIQMDKNGELDPEYMGKLIGLSVIAYCPNFSGQLG